MARGNQLDREQLLNNINSKLRALFPDGTDHAAEKRAEVLAFAAGEVFGRSELRDMPATAELSLADLEKLWRGVDGIVDAH